MHTEASSSTPLVDLDDGVLVFDVETTGTDKRHDQVIELCVQYGLSGSPDGSRAPSPRSRTWRFKPSVPIHPGAQAVHGISIEDLADCPPFAACADEITVVFATARVVIGYNIAFDIDMLQAEYDRLSRTAIDFSDKRIVDAFRLWQQFEPRSLQHAHKRFVGDSFAAAHSASADVAATARVLQGMLKDFGLAGQDWDSVAKVCDPEGRIMLGLSRSGWVGPSKHLQWNEAGQIVMTFGKHASVPLHVVARTDDGYLRWVIDKDFPPHVGEICKKALDLRRSRDAASELIGWARQRYGQAAPTETPAFAATSG